MTSSTFRFFVEDLSRLWPLSNIWHVCIYFFMFFHWLRAEIKIIFQKRLKYCTDFIFRICQNSAEHYPQHFNINKQLSPIRDINNPQYFLTRPPGGGGRLILIFHPCTTSHYFVDQRCFRIRSNDSPNTTCFQSIFVWAIQKYCLTSPNKGGFELFIWCRTIGILAAAAADDATATVVAPCCCPSVAPLLPLLPLLLRPKPSNRQQQLQGFLNRSLWRWSKYWTRNCQTIWLEWTQWGTIFSALSSRLPVSWKSENGIDGKMDGCVNSAIYNNYLPCTHDLFSK